MIEDIIDKLHKHKDKLNEKESSLVSRLKNAKSIRADEIQELLGILKKYSPPKAL